MAKSATADAMTKVVEILTPLESEERTRVIRAAMVLLGEEPLGIVPTENIVVSEHGGSEITNLAPRARAWMKQNGIAADELQQIFHMTEDGAEVIAPHMPGKNKKEQTYNAYILTGIGQLLLTGSASFLDKSARALCESSGCYDSANHSAHLKNKGNEFTGTKDKGWTLTAPGLKRAAEIIKELSKQAA